MPGVESDRTLPLHSIFFVTQSVWTQSGAPESDTQCIQNTEYSQALSTVNELNEWLLSNTMLVIT